MGIDRRGSTWAIRYYGPDRRQRWETIGPNKREAETVLAQRIYEVRSGKFPVSAVLSCLRRGVAGKASRPRACLNFQALQAPTSLSSPPWFR